MNIHLEIYNPNKTYIAPGMKEATPELIQSEISAVNNFKCVVYTDEAGEMLYEIAPFNALRSKLGIECGLSDEETLRAMEDILNTPEPYIEPELTAEERIAAALEFQNLLSM